MEDGCTFMVLLGDDIRLKSSGWKREIEDEFEEVAASTCFPLGVACVAFRDMSFSVFPTFPVIHRRHLEIFNCLLPAEFINQHGDPFLFDLYRRFGTSKFAPSASLENIIGGNYDARYDKHNFKWQTNVLNTAVDKVSSYLSSYFQSSGQARSFATVPCINVVVPSYRCQLSMLRGITTLSATSPASVHMLVAIDNPHVPLEPLRELEDWSYNHLVRVYQNSDNVGASQSRNTGIASSFGDWVVLLDDDVIPSRNLLDAYLGATHRNPDAMVLVGLTSLPDPSTLMQHALKASQLTFFYDVANGKSHGESTLGCDGKYMREGQDQPWCMVLERIPSDGWR